MGNATVTGPQSSHIRVIFKRHAHICCRVVIGTVGFVTLCVLERRATLLSFVIGGVEGDFFPTVAVATAVIQRATIAVSLHGFVRFPVVALDGSIAVVVRRAPEILPVVGVVAALTVVRDVRLRTPDCLEVK